MRLCICLGLCCILLFLNTSVEAVSAIKAERPAKTAPPAKAARPAKGPPPPLTASQYVHLGNISGRQGNYRQAVKEYARAIGVDPKLANAYYNRGYAYLEIRKYKLAMADLNKAIQINAQYAAAYHLRGILYFYKKKYPEAVGDYSKALDLDPENLKFHISRLSAYFKMGDGDNAWKEVIKIQQLGGTVNPTIINILKGKNYKD